jgi:sugar phosphate isomerase/epimerase
LNLGIFGKTFPRPALEDVLDAVAQTGLRVLQFNFASAGLPSLPPSVDPPLLERIRTAVQNRNLTLAAVSGTFNMIHPDPGQRAEGLRRFSILAGACRDLGVPTVTLCTGSRDPGDMWRPHPDNNLAQAWRDLTRSLEQALAAAARTDLVLAVEPEPGNVISSASKARRLLDEMQSPRLKIVMDPANLLQGWRPTERAGVLDKAFDLLGPDVVLAHAKELDAGGEAGGLAPGQGVLDWEHYLARLRGLDFTGPLVMHGLREAEVPFAVDYLTKAAARLGRG